MLWTGPRRVGSLSFVQRTLARRVTRQRLSSTLSRPGVSMEEQRQAILEYASPNPKPAHQVRPPGRLLGVLIAILLLGIVGVVWALVDKVR